MRKSWLIIGCIFLFACSKDEVPSPAPPVNLLYFPPLNNSEWQTISPVSLNWDTSKLPALYNYLQQEDSRAFIVLKNGKIVLEEYFGQNILGTGPFTQSTPWYWASAGKT